MLDTLAKALQWADSHGLTVPVILGAVTVLARLVWAALRPSVARRWPSAVPVIEGAAARVAALLPDVLAALLRRRAVVVVGTSLAVADPPPRASAPPAPSGQSGRATGAPLVLLALVGLVGLAACPRLPPVSDCAPASYRCRDDRPEVCSTTRRWHPVGDQPCSAVGGRCSLEPDGLAVCVSDGGAP